ncbi:MAG: hypothetical protein GY705_21115, partial [Bacteroidetes bacterium]|nr:hypothetical protein [Bacteroidota bacterium]
MGFSDFANSVIRNNRKLRERVHEKYFNSYKKPKLKQDEANEIFLNDEQRRIRACLKLHQSAPSDKFCPVLRYIFRRIACIRLQNMSCSEQNLPAFAQS